ncbi:hypothetical protein F5884DRAFT_759207 [Xylogone sp. PMI_703]|nr:hypothetical protein F5884DRAFT_759207 [Xylogone sp. PMI_703]
MFQSHSLSALDYFGLSYTTFAMADLRAEQVDINKEKEEMLVRFSVSNTGARRGRHIVQIYGLPGLDDFPARVLLNFTPVDLDAGESENITVSASLRPLRARSMVYSGYLRRMLK